MRSISTLAGFFDEGDVRDMEHQKQQRKPQEQAAVRRKGVSRAKHRAAEAEKVETAGHFV